MFDNCLPLPAWPRFYFCVCVCMCGLVNFVRDLRRNMCTLLVDTPLKEMFLWHAMSSGSRTGRPCEPSPPMAGLTGPAVQLLGRRSQLLWVESVTVTAGLETSVSCPVSYVLPTPPATMPPQLWEGFYPCLIFMYHHAFNQS